MVVLGLVFFHASLVFDTRDDYYVKNDETTEAITWVAGLGVVWAMPALFLIAGLGSWHSIRRRGTRGFVGERLLRLGVPLVFASLTIIPVPQWIRAGADEPYLEFLRRYFDVHLGLSNFPFVVRGDLFETGHLWFVVLLLTFSLMLALVAARLPPIGGPMRHRGVVFLPAVPIALVVALHGMEEPYAGWSRWAYLLFFLLGFLLAGDDRFRAAMRRDAKPAAVIGLLLFGAAGAALSTAGDDAFTALTGPAILARTLFGLAGWFWLVAILGLLDRDRPPAAPGARPSARTRYLAEAALPLYILHQPILVVVAFLVVAWELPMAVKYLAIVVLTYAIMFAVHDLLVRRTRVTRLLFGMRPAERDGEPARRVM